MRLWMCLRVRCVVRLQCLMRLAADLRGWVAELLVQACCRRSGVALIVEELMAEAACSGG